jgi:AraC-like DNA-binding protein
VRAVVGDMLVAAPGTTVAELAERHAVTPRTLQRAFADFVGVGPKWVLKRYRMHEAAERIAAGEASDGASLALDLGYFDQSHFIRDFTAQIGLPPSAYERACAAAAGRG